MKNTKLVNTKKMVISSKSELDLMKAMLTRKAFFNKFTICPSLVSTLVAEDTLKNVILN